jgi:hypothetical protein
VQGEPEVNVTSRPSEATRPAAAGGTAAAPVVRRRLDPRLVATLATVLLVLGAAVAVRSGFDPLHGDARGSGAQGGEVRLALPSIRVDPAGLAWPPPRLTDPQTVVVDAGHHSLDLDPDTDYRVVLPPSAATVLVGGVTIVGGHNVVVIGGVVNVPSMSKYPDKGPSSDQDKSGARRGMYLKGQTGTVHIEGVHFTGDLSDAFNLDEREGAVVQLENIRVDLVHGGRDLHHADVIQTWAGPRILRVDGLLAATQYQGFFLLPNQWFKDGPAPEEVVFRRTTVTMMPGSGYGLWLPQGDPSWLDRSGLTLRTVGSRPAEKLTWPDDGLGVDVIDDSAAVSLPAGTPGGSYTTPGYVASTS